MGQAVDLPDPLEAPATPAPNSSADDLLSQLAGEEIDRLLAESDAESAAKAEASPPAVETPAKELPPAPVADEGLATQLDKMLADADDAAALAASAATSSIAATPAAAAPAAEAPMSAKDLDAALAAASTAAQAATAQAAAAQSLAAQEAATTSDVQTAVNDIETSLQERGGLNDSSAGEVALDPTDDEATVPIYLKPLVWLNAPLMFLPEPIREALGKIAILTMFNAAAIIAYVMIFRRHHH